MKNLLGIAAIGVSLSICACTEGGSASGQNDPQDQDQSPKPEILSFTIDKPRVKANTSIRFNWKSRNAQTCLLKNRRNTVLADRSEGTFDTILKESGAFTLWCHNGSQSLERTLQAVVVDDSGLRLVDQDLGENPNLWNLDYLDGEINNRYTTVGSGLGVRLYVLDDGVFGYHSEFGGRVKEGANIIGEYLEETGNKGYPLKGWIDQIVPSNLSGDHGTHVAGIAASNTYGVAKDLEVIPVRVLSGVPEGSTHEQGLKYNDVLLKGLQFVLANEQHFSGGRAIVNLSTLFQRYMRVDGELQTLQEYVIDNEMSGFKGEFDEKIRNIIEKLVSANIVIVTASGNGGCGIGKYTFRSTQQYSPQFLASQIPGLVNVGNLSTNPSGLFANSTDLWPEFWLPGTDAVSTVGTIDENGTKYGSKVYSGTSMAAPLLSGMIAILLERNPLIKASSIERVLKENSELLDRLPHLYFGNESQSGSCRKIENRDVFLPKF